MKIIFPPWPKWFKISAVASVGAIVTHKLKFGNKDKGDEDGEDAGDFKEQDC